MKDRFANGNNSEEAQDKEICQNEDADINQDENKSEENAIKEQLKITIRFNIK